MRTLDSTKVGVTCVHCHGSNTIIESETCYDDGSDEPTTGNHLIEYKYMHCNDCGNDFDKPTETKIK